MGCMPHRRLIITCLLVSVSYTVQGALLDIQTDLEINEIYSDNINLSSAREEDEYVTQLQPGISFNHKSKKMDLDVQYAWEGLYYAKESRSNSYNHLNANVLSEIEEDTFYLQATGIIRQQVINNQNNLIIDNINPAARTNISTFTIGPSLRNRFGTIASSSVNFSFGRVDYDNTDLLADSDILKLNADLNSGNRFRSLKWNISYDFSETRRAVGDKSRYETLSASAVGQLTRTLYWRTVWEFINDDVQRIRALKTGYVFSVGLEWRPNPKMLAGGNYGKGAEDLYLQINPSSRTQIRVDYRNRDIGVNPGRRWSVLWKSGARRYQWNLSYGEDTSNLQALELTADLASVGGNTIFRNALIFNPTDEDFIRRMVRGGLSIKRPKSEIGITGSGERRRFLVSDTRDYFYTIDLNWLWLLSPRSALTVGMGYIARHFGDTSIDDNNLYATTVLSRRLSRRARMEFSYRYIERDQKKTSITDYEENRLNLGIRMNF